jgi:hypothetical protein
MMSMGGLRQGTLLLEADPGLKSLGIRFVWAIDADLDDLEWGEGQNAQTFHQFVDALEQHQDLEELRFCHYRFCLAGPTDLDVVDEDVEVAADGGVSRLPPVAAVRLHGVAVGRMFGQVLPHHLSIGTLQFSGCRIHPHHLASLLAALRSTQAPAYSPTIRRTRPLALDFVSCDLSQEA